MNDDVLTLDLFPANPEEDDHALCVRKHAARRDEDIAESRIICRTK